MKKKVLSVVLSVAMVAAMLAGCGEAAAPAADAPAVEEPAAEEPAPAAEAEEPAAEEVAEEPAAEGDNVINLWSFTDEIPGMVDKFLEANPDFGYTVNTTIIATTDGAYQPALDAALAAGGADAPDMYAAEAAFILKYAQGDAYQYACPYKDLGIDVDAELKAADIAQYTVDIGTNPEGDLVALGYQATGGAFIYRRSIAKDVFGTDDPAEIGRAHV